MNTKPLTMLILLLGATSDISRGQANPSQVEDLSVLLASFQCKDNISTGAKACRAVLPAPLDTKRSRTGDHFLMKAALAAGPAEQPIAMLDVAIVEVQPATKGRRSMLRLRIDRALDKDGREVPARVNIVAFASQSAVTERWDAPLIIADRFPSSPEDEQRLPGERKFSEDQRQTSPLDTITDLPVHYTMVCNKKAKKASGNTCIDLLDAHGTYGYDGVTLEPPAADSSVGSVLSSKKNICFRGGTVMVLEVKRIRAPQKS